MARKSEKFIKFDKNNPFIEFTKNSRQFRCIECDKLLKNESGAIVHSTRTHKMNLDGTPSKSKIKKKNDSSKVSNVIPEPEYEENLSDESDVMAIHATDDAKSAVKIVKDIPLMYTYYMLKEKRILHPYWSLHDFLREAAYLYAQEYGVVTTFYQDPKLLSAGKRKAMELIKERWAEYDFDQLDSN